MSLDNAQAAILSVVRDQLDGVPTAYENMPFTKPNASKWAEVFFLPNTPSVETLGQDGQDLVDGILQLNLNYPVGTGSGEARTDYESIRAVFPAGARSAYNGQQVIVTRCGRSPGRVVDGWYRVSITIDWYALIPR